MRHTLLVVTVSTLILIVCHGCSFSSPVSDFENSVQLNPVTGYFSKRKPYMTEGHVLNKRSFERYFSPARTMGDSLPEVDFDTHKVAAIIMPETPYDTRIILNRAFVEDSILRVQYSIHEVLEKRSYTMIPVRLFTFDSEVKANYIHFEYGDHIIKKPIK